MAGSYGDYLYAFKRALDPIRGKKLDPNAPGATRENAIGLAPLVVTASRTTPKAYTDYSASLDLPSQLESIGGDVFRPDLGRAAADKLRELRRRTNMPSDAASFVPTPTPRAPDTVGAYEGTDEEFQRGSERFDDALARRSDFMRQSEPMRVAEKFAGGVTNAAFLGRTNQFRAALDPVRTTADYDLREAALPKATGAETTGEIAGGFAGMALPFGVGAKALRVTGAVVAPAELAANFAETGRAGRMAVGAVENAGFSATHRDALEDPNVLRNLGRDAALGAGFGALGHGPATKVEAPHQIVEPPSLNRDTQYFDRLRNAARAPVRETNSVLDPLRRAAELAPEPVRPPRVEPMGPNVGIEDFRRRSVDEPATSPALSVRAPFEDARSVGMRGGVNSEGYPFVLGEIPSEMVRPHVPVSGETRLLSQGGYAEDAMLRAMGGAALGAGAGASATPDDPLKGAALGAVGLSSLSLSPEIFAAAKRALGESHFLSGASHSPVRTALPDEYNMGAALWIPHSEKVYLAPNHGMARDLAIEAGEDVSAPFEGFYTNHNRLISRAESHNWFGAGESEALKRSGGMERMYPGAPPPRRARIGMEGEVAPISGPLPALLGEGSLPPRSLVDRLTPPVRNEVGAPERITLAAIRDPQTGKVYTGENHGIALDRAADDGASWSALQMAWDRNDPNVTGFSTNRRPFISRDEMQRVTRLPADVTPIAEEVRGREVVVDPTPARAAPPEPVRPQPLRREAPPRDYDMYGKPLAAGHVYDDATGFGRPAELGAAPIRSLTTLAGAGAGATWGAASNPDHPVAGATLGGIAGAAFGYGGARVAENLLRETPEHAGVVRYPGNQALPDALTHEAIVSGSATLRHRFNEGVSATVRFDPEKGTYSIVEQGGTNPRVIRDLPSVDHANAYARSAGFHVPDNVSRADDAQKMRAAVDASSAAKYTSPATRARELSTPMPEPGRSATREPLPLPPLHLSIDPESILPAWNVVSARYPRLASTIRGIGPLDKDLARMGAGGNLDNFARELQVPPGQAFSSDALFHEITHAAQAARRKIGLGIEATPEEVAELEDYAYRVQRAYAAAHGGPEVKNPDQLDHWFSRAITGTAVGGAAGAYSDEEHPLRGALSGALAGGALASSPEILRSMRRAVGSEIGAALRPALEGTRVVDESGIPKVVYHGTGEGFDHFSPVRNADSLQYGPGYYWTESPEIASGYAKTYGNSREEILDTVAKYRQLLADPERMRRMGTERGTIEALIKQEERVLSHGPERTGGPNVRPARLAIKAPFDIDLAVDPAEASRLVERAERAGRTRLPASRAAALAEEGATNEAVYWALVSAAGGKRGAAKVLKGAGYDGITHIGGGPSGSPPHRVWIAFDRPQIRSAFGPAEDAAQAGAVDPSHPLVRTLGGATVGAVAGGAADAATGDDRSPLEGIVGGALLGAVGANAFRRPTAGALDLPEHLRADYHAAEARIDWTGALQRQADRVASPHGVKQHFDATTDWLANVHGPIDRLGQEVEGLVPYERNPRDLRTQWSNRDQHVQRALQGDGIPDPLDPGKVIAPPARDMVAHFGGNPEAIRQAFTYAVDKRLVGRGVQGYGGDVAAFERGQRLVEHFDQQPEMQQFATKLREYTDGLGDYAVRSGLFTPEQWKAIQDSDALYIPTRRVMGGVKQGGHGGGAGKKLASVTSGVKAFTGSQRAVMDPATALGEWTAGIIRRSDAYRVGDATIDAIQKLPGWEQILTPVPAGEATAAIRRAKATAMARNADLPEAARVAMADLAPFVQDSHNPIVWRNGPKGREEYLMNSPALYNALGMLQDQDGGALRKIADTIFLPLRKVFTTTTTGLSIPFAFVRNPGRDVVDTLAKSQAGVTPVDIARGFAEGIGGAVGKSQFAERMRNYGLGRVSVIHDASPTDLGAIKRSVFPTSKTDRLRDAVRTVARRGTGYSVLEGATNAIEAGPRFGEAHAFLRKAAPQVESGEVTQVGANMRAATLGRELMDFTNEPGSAVVREAKRYVPFFGAAMQGLTTHAKGWERNPARMATVASGVALASTISWAMKHRSDDVRDRENERLPEERASSLFFPLSGDRDGATLKLPLSQEFGIIAQGVQAGLDAMADKDPHAAQLFTASIRRALPPYIGDVVPLPASKSRTLGDVLAVPIPGVQQMTEVGMNARTFDGAPIVPESMKNLPPAERRRDDTPATADLLAGMARGMGFDQASPLAADHLIRGVTGQYTNVLTAATDPLARAVMGRYAPPEQIPQDAMRNPRNPAAALFANPNPSNTVSERDFYDLKQRITEAQTAIRKAQDDGDTDLFRRTLSDYGYLARPEAQEVMDALDDETKGYREDGDLIREEFQAGRIAGDRAHDLQERLRRAEADSFHRAMRILRQLSERH